MKKAALAIIAILAYSHNACSQNNQWKVKSGEEINESVPDSVRFRYPQFVTGHIYFKDGIISNAPLNYNLLNGEMQFITRGKDTLTIANEVTIKFIVINNDSFYYDKVYMELVTGNASVKLAKKESLKIGDVEKISAYDQPSSTSAMSTISYLYNGSGDLTKLNQRVNLLLIKQTLYYIGDNYNHFLPANKKNVIKMFGRKQHEIENFLNENKIGFNKEDDLKKLVNFLQKI